MSTAEYFAVGGFAFCAVLIIGAHIAWRIFKGD